ncbi:hypothetical protein KEJ37_00470 [Candidatus Bathyarchaeota archaeon]|nr:hypothetical protein [Candidatus Bathyarchaeota archaeon]
MKENASLGAVDVKEIKNQFKAIVECVKKHGKLIKNPLLEPAEEELPIDLEKREDDEKFRKRECFNIEVPENYERPYVPLGEPLHREKKHLFRFFLDGSLKTYYLGEYIIPALSFPFMAGEIAAACLFRNNNGTLSVPLNGFKRRICLLFPNKSLLPDSLQIELEETTKKLESYSGLKVEPQYTEETESKDWRSSLRAKGISEMHETEVQLAKSVRENSATGWLVIDGAIRKKMFLDLENVIGLAKSFSRLPIFEIENRTTLDIVKLLARLGEGERTIIFKQGIAEGDAESSVKKVLGFWYLRLRTGEWLENPLQGVVKVEMKIEKDVVDSKTIDVVNEVSKALLAERTVSPYPTPRWHAHIYPIYVAENYIKSNFLSQYYFRGLLA